MTEPEKAAASKARLLAVEPQLFVSDISASCAFFRRIGFEVAFVYGDPPTYGQVRRDGVRLNLRHVDSPVFSEELRASEPDLLSASIEVDRVQKLAEEFRAAGLTFHQKLRKEPWGAETFILKDLDANLILFVGGRA